MNSINSRLRKLEERGVDGPCQECGDNPPSPELIAVYADDTPEELRFSPDGEIPEGEQFCPECGRQRYVILEIHYDR
jgi:hypothetical protein